MFKSNRSLALIVAALALALGSGLTVSNAHAAIPENASSQLEQISPLP
jgi:hypothetical protein